MDKLGERLREERQRLRYTQAAFAAVGGVLANAQHKYEAGLRSPSAVYLARLAEIEVDLLYVLTGRRSHRRHYVGVRALIH
ncbi:helix-turn-helix domain-containing protein [Pseudomonas lurida]